jgi:hypothetical protein
MPLPEIAVIEHLVAESLLQQVAEGGQIIAGIASVIALYGVVAVWRQTRQAAQTSETELITGMTALITTVGGAFIEHPEMRQYFYAKRTPKRRHYERAHAIAVALVGALDHVAAHFDEMDEATRDAWKQYFNDLYDNSPVVQEHLRTYSRWYGPKLREHYGLDRESPRGA